MSELTPNPVDVAPQPAVTWDPFQLMDRMDEEALQRELDGVAATDLVYVVKEGGQEVVGLSKTGVDECCMALVSQGQVIREEDLQHEVLGEGEDREALFKVKAARFAVSPVGAGGSPRPGHRRQAAAPVLRGHRLDLDARVPSRKYKGKSYRELLASDEGREYLGLDGGELQRARDPRLRPPHSRRRGGRQPSGAGTQSSLVRGGRNEGRAECPVPPHSGDRCAPRSSPPPGNSGQTRVIEPQRPAAPRPRPRAHRGCRAASGRTRRRKSRSPSTSGWPSRRCLPTRSAAAPSSGSPPGPPVRRSRTRSIGSSVRSRLGRPGEPGESAA